MLDTTIYNTVQDEMITRAPHFEADGQTHTETYKEDRAKVWELLMELCGTRMDCWTYIECRQPNQDGRAGFLGLYNNYLGPNKVDNQAAKVEAKLLNTTYAGEKKRWNFDKYVQASTHLSIYHAPKPGTVRIQRNRCMNESAFPDGWNQDERLGPSNYMDHVIFRVKTQL